METLAQIAIYIINTLGSLFVSLVLLRFLCQLVRADYYNPISKALVKFTNPVLIPLRKVIPGFFGIDFAAVVLALAVQMLLLLASIWLQGYSISNLLVLLPWAMVSLFGLLLNFYFIGIIIIFIASWVAPYSNHPALSLLRQLMEPLLAPFRKILPPLGPLDLSTLVFFMTLQIVRHYLFPLLVNLVGMPPQLLFFS